MCLLLGNKGDGKSLRILEILVALWFRYWSYSPLSCNKWNSDWFKGSCQCDSNTCHTLARKSCPTCPSWLLAKRMPDTGQSCISNLDQDCFWSHVWRVFLGNKEDLKKVGCSTPPHVSYICLIICLFQGCLGTFRDCQTWCSNWKSADTMAIQWIEVCPEID